MLKKLERFLGKGIEFESSAEEYDPVYGLPRRAVQEWLAHNPRLRKEYAVQEWLAHNPPLREEYERTLQQGRSA
jgi:hypothetical protein